MIILLVICFIEKKSIIQAHEQRTFPWASTGALRLINKRATLILPYLAAKCNGVNPFCKIERID